MPSGYPILREYKECLGLTWSRLVDLLQMLAEDEVAGPVLGRLIARMWLTDYRRGRVAAACRVGPVRGGRAVVECEVRHPAVELTARFEAVEAGGGRWRLCDGSGRCLESEEPLSGARMVRAWLGLAARRLLEEMLAEEARRRARHCPVAIIEGAAEGEG